jgi:hypothetical protein
MRYLVLAVLVVAIAGCGGGSSTRTPSQPTPRAAELVAFQRNGGLAATLDTVTVRADGSTRADKRYGGAGRRYADFQLSPALFARLRAALARLPARLPRTGAGQPKGNTYLLRYRGRTYAARQGAVPAVLRAAIATLDAIADGAGRSGHVKQVRQSPTQ